MSTSEVFSIIKGLKNKNSSGYDGLNSIFVKKIKSHITYPLSIIINQSLFSGKVPDGLKIAKIIPLYKKKDETKFDNYRPIALLPIFSKIFEKIVPKQMHKFLSDNDSLFKSQLGFCKNLETSTFDDNIQTWMLIYPTSTAVNQLVQVVAQGNVTIAADDLDELGALLALLEVDFGRAAGVKRKAIGDLETPPVVSENSMSCEKKLCTKSLSSSPSLASVTVETVYKIKLEENAPSKVLPKSSITCFFCDLDMPSGTDQNLYLQHLEVKFPLPSFIIFIITVW